MYKPVLIPPDATNTEASRHIALSLLEIYKTAKIIFFKIEDRLNICQKKADDINLRIDLINQKIKFLENTDNAMLTYPSRYPATEKNSLEILFERDNFSSYIEKEDDKILYKEDAVNSLKIKEAIKRKKDYGYAFGKGKHFESLQKTKMDDNYGILDEDYIYKDKEKKELLKEKSEIQNESLLIYNFIGKSFETDPFAYKPQLGDLSTFDFPDILPNLGGIKKPELQEEWTFPSIAPSANDSNIVSNEKEQLDLTTPKSMYKQKVENTNENTINKSSKSEEVKHNNAPEIDLPQTLDIQKQLLVLSSPPPPPPPPPAPFSISTVNETENTQIKAESSTQLLHQSPPPPPPPPPLPSMNNLPSLPDISKGRSDLMDSIRKAGGAGKAKLKSVKTPEKEKLENKPKVADETGDDLMSSLAKALEQRRKGISGNNKKKMDKARNVQSTGEPFSRLRYMPEIKSLGSDNDDDGNWD